MLKEVFTGPWYPWYASKALDSEDIAALSLAEEGAYRRALDIAWKKGSIPADPAKLAAVIGKRCTAQIAAKITDLFSPMRGDPSRLVNNTLERIRSEQQERHGKRVQAGRHGGRPRTEPNENGGRKSIAKALLNQSQSYTPPYIDIYKEEEEEEKEKKEQKKEKENVAIATTAAANASPQEVHLGIVLAGVKKELGVSKLTPGSEREWTNHAKLALDNGFSPTQFLDCFHTLRQLREYAIKPEYVTDGLPELEKLQKALKKKQQANTVERLPTLEEKLAADEEARRTTVLTPPPKKSEAKEVLQC